ncbi:MAG: hypothetical protein WKF87_13285 [Chryseolinea sp.]
MYTEKETFDLPDDYCTWNGEQRMKCLLPLVYPIRFHGLNHASQGELLDYLEKYCAGRESKRQEENFKH